MKLYCFGESGHSYKAALALELAGCDWQPVFVDFFNGETRTEAYRKDINNMGEAPVLVDGEIKLSQSGVIQSYIAEKTAVMVEKQRLKNETFCVGSFGTTASFQPQSE